MSGGGNPAASGELGAKYKVLYTEYALAVTAAYFCDNRRVSGPGATYEWQGPHGALASEHPPLENLLQAPRLAADLAQYLSGGGGSAAAGGGGAGH